MGGPKEACLHGRAHWRHLANTTETSVCGSDATLCQITFDRLLNFAVCRDAVRLAGSSATADTSPVTVVEAVRVDQRVSSTFYIAFLQHSVMSATRTAGTADLPCMIMCA